MKSLLRSLFAPPAESLAAATLYAALVDAARAPCFYAECGVPDTVDGRFEMIVLHLFLAAQRLKSEPDTGPFLQRLQECFFDDMDRSVRELGASDTGVGKRMKTMARAWFGHVEAYASAVDEAAFQAALTRNVYATCAAPPTETAVKALYARMKATEAALAKAGVAALCAGRFVAE